LPLQVGRNRKRVTGDRVPKGMDPVLAGGGGVEVRKKKTPREYKTNRKRTAFR